MCLLTYFAGSISLFDRSDDFLSLDFTYQRNVNCLVRMFILTLLFLLLDLSGLNCVEEKHIMVQLMLIFVSCHLFYILYSSS